MADGLDGRTLLVTGGARSGKSRYAQAIAEDCGGALVYVATADALDDEMRARIDRHRGDRDGRWRTVEAPTALAAAIDEAGQADATLLVDCLTLWVSNLLLAERDVAKAADALVAAIVRSPARIVLVTNEVGSGIVPANALARAFRDAAGLVNQQIAAAVDRVRLVACGLPLVLK